MRSWHWNNARVVSSRPGASRLSPGFFLSSSSHSSQRTNQSSCTCRKFDPLFPSLTGHNLPHQQPLRATWQTTWKQKYRRGLRRNFITTDISLFKLNFIRHAVPSRQRASLRTDARAVGSPDAFLHRGHSGQKRVRVQPGRSDADTTVSKLIFHKSDTLLSDSDLRAHADPPGFVSARTDGHVRVHLPVPALRGRLYARADPTRPYGWDFIYFSHLNFNFHINRFWGFHRWMSSGVTGVWHKNVPNA